MASLKFILDMDDPELPALDKKEGTSSSSHSSRDRDSQALDCVNPTATAPSPDHRDRLEPATSINPRSIPSSESSQHQPTTSLPLPPPSSSSVLAHHPDDMDRRYGGHAPGAGAMAPLSASRRSIGAQPGGEIPVKLTPITGRVSRAKKGVPVHTCDTCRPPKTFTRAEHLRRHQLSHQTPQFPCTYAGCKRAFHRADLLNRHLSRHEQEGDKVSSSSSRRTSMTSADGGVTTLSFGTRGSTGIEGSASSHGSISGPSSDFYSGGHTAYQPMTPQHGGGQTGTSMSPAYMPVRRDSYRPASRSTPHGEHDAYRPASESSVPPFMNGHLSSADSLSGSANIGPNYQEPRTSSPATLYSVTENLNHDQHQLHRDSVSEANLPGLIKHEPGWASSDSEFSEGGHRKSWAPRYPSTTSEWHSGQVVSTYPPATATQDMASVNVSFTNPFSSAPQPINSGMELPMSYQDSSSMFGHHFSPVRSPTPPNMSVQSAETLVTYAPATPVTPLLVTNYKTLPNVMSSFVSPSYLSTATLPPSLQNFIPSLLEVYWKRFDNMYPVVHRPLFEAPSPTDGTRDVLKCAMAAVASQLSDNKDDRIKGSQLHEFAWLEVKRIPQWNIAIMQAILLCEFYARFRGRRAVTRSTYPFQSLYSRVSYEQSLNCVSSDSVGPTMLQDSPFPFVSASSHATWNPYSTSPLQAFHGEISVNNSNDSDFISPTSLDPRWATWVKTEIGRRLLAACFVLDVHTHMCYEQPLTQQFASACPPIPLTMASKSLWEAPTAQTWESLYGTQDSSLGLSPSILSDELFTAGTLQQAPSLDRAVMLASMALSLPRINHSATSDYAGTPDLSATLRLQALWPDHPMAHLYLALHATPLHDLLTVSGDSWCFTQKVLSETQYMEQKRRLGLWTSSANASKAASSAASALLHFLGSDNQEYGKRNLSEAWAVYVCTLILWALGQQGRSSSMSQAGEQMAQRTVTGANDNAEQDRKRDHQTIQCLRAIANSESLESSLDVRGHRPEIMNLLSIVHRRLVSDTIGGRNRLLVDAIGVLQRLERG